MDLQKWIDKGYEVIVDFGPKVLAAIAIWIIGSWIIKSLIKGNHPPKTKFYCLILLKNLLLTNNILLVTIFQKKLIPRLFNLVE